MKTIQHFWLYWFLMLILQLVICNYFLVSPLVTLSLLPAMVFCLPVELSTVLLMLIAFATGLSVDILAEGVLGLNAIALVPVALFKKPLMRMLFDRDSVERGNGFSFKRNGGIAIAIALTIELVIFLTIYIIADGAGTREISYNLLHFLASFAACLTFGMICTHILTKQNN